jgi:hypothetical protein
MRVPAARFALLATLPLILSGCDVIASYMYGLPGTGGLPGAPEITNEYTRGEATLTITQAGESQTIEMELAPYSMFDPSLGAYVTWAGEGGWSVSIGAYAVTTPGVPVISGDVTVTRELDDGTFWIAGSYVPPSAGNKCAVHVWTLSATNLEGAVNCTAMIWVDGMEYEQAPVDDQQQFEVGFDFHAEAPLTGPGQNG